MAYSTPWWRINERPRFTALTIGAYMAADDGPRETIRRDMKYERVARTLRYDDARKAIAQYLSSKTRDLKILMDCEDYLKQEISGAINHDRKQNLKHQLRALSDFQRSLNQIGIYGLQIQRAGHVFRPLEIEGVTISIQPTAIIRQARPRGADLVGGIIVDLAKGPSCGTIEAKAKVEKAMRYSSVMLHSLAEGAIVQDGEKASPENCIVMHAHRGDVVTAPQNYKTMIKNMEAVCRDIKRAWDDIDPPDNFDLSKAKARH